MPIETATIEAIKTAKPTRDLLLLTGGGYEAVAVVPQKAEMDLYRDLMFNDKTQARAAERLVRACIAHPGLEEVGEMLNKKPMLAEKWAKKLIAEAGDAEEVEAKKL